VLAVVTTEGDPFCVGVVSGVEGVEVTAATFELELELESELVFESELEPELDVESDVLLCSLPTLLFSPVSWTDQEFGPPHESKL